MLYIQASDKRKMETTSPPGRKRFYFIACLLLFLATIGRYWVYDRSETVPHDPESFRLARNIAERG